MREILFHEQVEDDGVAWITLAREEVHNAFNETLIAELTATLGSLASDPRVRIVVLTARGRSFSAGADLRWMAAMAEYDEAGNLEDARALARLMRSLNELPKPTLALVQGPALGGGVGLVACCDIAIAAESAFFALSEVRLGLIPSVISPYVVAAMGSRAARRYFLTGEHFSAEEALHLGLVHRVVPGFGLEVAGRETIKALLAGGPGAQSAAKRLVFDLAGRRVDDALIEDTADRIARIRVSEEGREGISAFLEKRRPNWGGS